jgi:hypothetical protein
MSTSITQIENGYIVTKDGKQQFCSTWGEAVYCFNNEQSLRTRYASGKSISDVKLIIDDCEWGNNTIALVTRLRECYEPIMNLKEAVELIKLFASIKNPAKSSP